jgi:hypothetical protein
MVSSAHSLSHSHALQNGGFESECAEPEGNETIYGTRGRLRNLKQSELPLVSLIITLLPTEYRPNFKA